MLGAARKSTTIPELESLRGVAALLIVLYHVPGWHSALYEIHFVRNCHLMVDLFFVLSGFVIYRAYEDRLHSFADVMRFQFLRFGRLYPVHVVVLLAFLGVEVIKAVAASVFQLHSPNSTPFGENSWTALAQHLLLVQGIAPSGRIDTWNGPAWSISVEFYTYMVFGVVALWAHRLAAMAMICGLAVIALASGHTAGFDALLLCFAGFFVGALTAHVAAKTPLRLPDAASGVALGILVAFLAYKPHGQYNLLILPITALLIYCIAQGVGGPIQRTLRVRWLVALGTLSYSMYMTHALVLWTVNQAARVVLALPEHSVAGKSVPVLDLPTAALAYGLSLAAVLVISTLMQRYVERPMRDKSRAMVGAGLPLPPMQGVAA